MDRWRWARSNDRVAIDRKPVFYPRGVVATSQPLAASAGLAVRRRGGNAVDAAVAAAITLTVVQPGSNDIGGDLFAIVWDGHRLHGLNGSGRAPAALTRARVLDSAPAGQMPDEGWLTVTVPGAPAAWNELHSRFGSLPFASLFDDAIAHAEAGYPVSPTIAEYWQRGVDRHSHLEGPEFAAWPTIFAPGGRAPQTGAIWRNPDAARSLRRIAATGAEALYTGEIADAIADFSAQTGGTITYEDLASHASLWVEPMSVRYRGHEVWELPPNGQGLAALLALSILDGVDLANAP